MAAALVSVKHFWLAYMVCNFQPLKPPLAYSAVESEKWDLLQMPVSVVKGQHWQLPFDQNEYPQLPLVPNRSFLQSRQARRTDEKSQVLHSLHSHLKSWRTNYSRSFWFVALLYFNANLHTEKNSTFILFHRQNTIYNFSPKL